MEHDCPSPSPCSPSSSAPSSPSCPLLFAPGSGDEQHKSKIKSFQMKFTYLKEPRKRTRTSPEQLQVLLSFFEKDTVPNVKQRRVLAEKTGMTPRSVQVWFQNRRAKHKIPHPYLPHETSRRPTQLFHGSPTHSSSPMPLSPQSSPCSPSSCSSTSSTSSSPASSPSSGLPSPSPSREDSSSEYIPFQSYLKSQSLLFDDAFSDEDDFSSLAASASATPTPGSPAQPALDIKAELVSLGGCSYEAPSCVILGTLEDPSFDFIKQEPEPFSLNSLEIVPRDLLELQHL